MNKTGSIEISMKLIINFIIGITLLITMIGILKNFTLVFPMLLIGLLMLGIIIQVLDHISMGN